MGNGFAFARWVSLAYSYLSSEGGNPVFYACARDEWRIMQREPQSEKQP